MEILGKAEDTVDKLHNLCSSLLSFLDLSPAPADGFCFVYLFF